MQGTGGGGRGGDSPWFILAVHYFQPIQSQQIRDLYKNSIALMSSGKGEWGWGRGREGMSAH